jgi:hypothetical protein
MLDYQPEQDLGCFHGTTANQSPATSNYGQAVPPQQQHHLNSIASSQTTQASTCTA